MGKLFKTRELFSKYLWLDALRMNLLGWISNHGSSFFDRSYRRVRVIASGARPYINDGKPHVLALYHGSMIAILGMKPRHKLTVLISESRDGEMIARGITGMGFSVARGSPAKGGVKGALQMIEAAKSGQNLAFMVDGPRGPIFEVKIGVIRLAEMTGLPIIPVGFRARSALHLKSWDQWRGTSWGGPEVFIFGEPIFVPPGSGSDDLENLRSQLQTRMERLRSSAETFWSAEG